MLDNYAYLVHQAGRRAEYDTLVREWVRTYDRLFKVPITEAPSFDGRRDTSQTFQQAIDATIDALADQFDVRFHPLDPARRDSWVDTVLTASGLPLHPPQIDLFRAQM